MGGKRKQGNSTKNTTGVEIRHWSSGTTTLRISFYYRDIQCRETLKLEATPSNIKYASRLRSEILNAIERGTFSYADYFPRSKFARRFGHIPTNVTIGELLTDFLVQIKSTREYSTYIGYKKVCDAHLLPNFGTIAIQDLKPIVIREWLRKLDITSKTVSNILIPLRTIIEQAINDEYIKSNPLDKIIISKLLNKNTSKSNFKVDPFDKDEIKAILDAARHPQIKNLFQFAFFSGLRTSELIALEWDDVDFENDMLFIRRAIVKKQVKGTKTLAGERDIMLLPPALNALQAQKNYTFNLRKYVFHNPRTNKPWETDHQIRRTAWIYALQDAKVRYRNPYQTRHTYASMMLSNGENIMWVAEQMGHADTEMVMKVYGKWIPDTSLKRGYKLVNNWEQYIEQKNPLQALKYGSNKKFNLKSTTYMVEAATI